MRKGAPWLKTTLIQGAVAATRTKGSYLQALFHRLRSRRGAKKAIGAVAASILTAAYHMLKNGTRYQDLGSPTILTTARKASKRYASSLACKTLATPFRSRLWRRQHEVIAGNRDVSVSPTVGFIRRPERRDLAAVPAAKSACFVLRPLGCRVPLLRRRAPAPLLMASGTDSQRDIAVARCDGKKSWSAVE
jgi:hypothetical protein